jgi:hypothetical protein
LGLLVEYVDEAVYEKHDTDTELLNINVEFGKKDVYFLYYNDSFALS